MKIHRFLFYLLLALLSTQLTKYFFPEFAFVAGIRVDYLAPVIYLTDIIIVGIFLTWIRQIKIKISSKSLLFFSLFLIGVAVNIFAALSPAISFLKWIKILEAIFLAFYIFVEKPSLKTSSLTLLFGGLYSCFLAWLQFIQQSSLGGIFWWVGERTFTVTTPGIARFTFNNQLFVRPYATFPHPNVLAGFLTCLLPFIFYSKNLNKTTKLLCIPVLILFLATIAITFSQSAWIVAIFTTIIFVLKEIGVRVTKSLAAAGIIGMIGIFIRLSQFIEPESIERRVVLAKNSLVLIQEHLFYGVGLNNFIVANEHQISINSYQDLQPVHSIYLLFLTETGILGILLVIAAILLLYKKIKISKNSFYFIWSFGVLLKLGFVDHYPLTIHQTLLLGGVLTGFILLTSLSVIHLNKGESYGKRSK